MTERMGFWVDMDDPYVTLHDEYIESAWWSLKQMFEDAISWTQSSPHCPQTGTSLSSHEVSLGYKEVLSLLFAASSDWLTMMLYWHGRLHLGLYQAMSDWLLDLM